MKREVKYVNDSTGKNAVRHENKGKPNLNAQKKRQEKQKTKTKHKYKKNKQPKKQNERKTNTNTRQNGPGNKPGRQQSVNSKNKQNNKEFDRLPCPRYHGNLAV